MTAFKEPHKSPQSKAGTWDLKEVYLTVTFLGDQGSFRHMTKFQHHSLIQLGSLSLLSRWEHVFSSWEVHKCSLCTIEKRDWFPVTLIKWKSLRQSLSSHLAEHKLEPLRRGTAWAQVPTGLSQGSFLDSLAQIVLVIIIFLIFKFHAFFSLKKNQGMFIINDGII